MHQEEIAKYDRENFLRVIEHYPQQIEEAMRLAKGMKTLENIDKIVVTGMGGSGIPGDILQTELRDESIPVFVNKDYKLPGFANSKTLVFCISYSGNTEETISAFKDAVKKKCAVIAVTSGGKLKELAKAHKAQCITVPSGIQPRSAVCYLFFPMLIVLQNSMLIKDRTRDINASIKALQSSEWKAKAEEIAERLVDKIPLVYSDNNLACVGLRWKQALNENAKVHAFAAIFPELDHNELVGYTKLKGKYHVIMIRDNELDKEMTKRMHITKEIITKTGVPSTEVLIKGPSLLSKIFIAIYLGDLASFFLAMHYKIDPSPVKLVEYLKNALKG
jgi:glucose/mannose-6-phosphate isomerase